MQGTRLGPYEILSELGSGGMGTVFLAELTEADAGLETGQRVALKVIHPHLLETKGFFKRFMREARIGQQVRHENVVRTYDCDATLQEGVQQNYLVMEYVAGQTLRELLQELGRLPEELCRHVGREIAKGLAAIHEAGVVHRDMKPENVLITDEHVVKVMDLGVARLQDEAIRLSQAGTFVGSLEYAAPEQFRGADDAADGRADLFALGSVLYELGTGQHPFRDEDARKVLRNILDEQPRKPGEVNPQLSPFFEEVVSTLLVKEPDERFASAAALVEVLETGEAGTWWEAQAKALRIQTKQPLRRIRIPRETALYGRDNSLARMHALFEEAKAGNGQALLIEGEAGIGKTRLVDEFVGQLRQAGEDVNFLFGSYPPGGAATASGAFSSAYRKQFGPEGSAAWLTQTPILVPAFDALLRGEPAPKDVEALTKDSIGTVFVHATRGLAAERPTIVLIDDLHFAPEDARSLFMTLALAAPGHRVLLLGTMRPGVDEHWVADLTRLEQASHLELNRLGPKDLINLLKDAFRSERLAEQLGVQVAVKSDGNPFFAFEIIRGLREGQFITQGADGSWISTQVIQNIQIPSSVMDLIQARLGDLGDEEKDLLDVAACCGFEFDPLVVAEAMGLGRIPALKRLARIELRHRLVRSAGEHFLFDHHQVQESLYAALPPPLAREYHSAIATAIEALSGAGDVEPEALDGTLCVELCEHYLLGSAGDSAVRYLTAALSYLERNYLNDRMIALAKRALETPDLLKGDARARLLLRLNNPLALLARRDDQEALLEEALALAEAGEDAVLQARVRNARGYLLGLTGRRESARVDFEAAIELARRAGDRKEEASATMGVAGVMENAGNYEEAINQLKRGLEIAREIEDTHTEIRGRSGLGMTYFRLGRYEAARRELERSIELSRALGVRATEGVATSNLTGVLTALGRRAEARAQIEHSLAIAREVGNRHSEAISEESLASAFLLEGRSAEALTRHEQSLAMFREIGDRRAEGDRPPQPRQHPHPPRSAGRGAGVQRSGARDRTQHRLPTPGGGLAVQPRGGTECRGVRGGGPAKPSRVRGALRGDGDSRSAGSRCANRLRCVAGAIRRRRGCSRGPGSGALHRR